MLPDLFLERPGCHVLAPGSDKEVLLAPGDGEETVFIQRTEVSGAEEPVHERFRIGCLVGVVALENADALDQDLAVVGHPDGGARHGNAHSAHLGP
ncbi:hypothetical protein D9M72_639580 [compost metagenome]